ncbi:peptidase M20 [Desulfosarcina alkanivorans]|uniref:Peptidase M20 n=1 Tax=Desulfosarcina alkanivorans TaxID=571177 RepID=A0A5K7YHS4_9BACT|nr:M20 family metallopeptidase [Desulfosarcina alkanivorans]BBO68686.1 peptidase M20 [Desulfosarcina alkanivorans]
MTVEINTFVADRLDTFMDDLETLVNIDSSSDNPAGIAAVARFLGKRLEAIGFSSRLEKLGGRGVPCLQAQNRPPADRFDILFLGHMDTVFPQGEVDARPFAVDGGRATGPGVCDMKGGLLVALHALETLHHRGVLEHLAVGVCFNGDEEVGSEASRGWIETHARNSDRVFVFEPCRPGFRFVLARKGGGGFRIAARGVSAHAGAEPEKGANAALEIAHQAIAIARFNDQAPEGTSAHVTVIRGGEKTNIIPDEAQASVDVRVARKIDVAPVEAFFNSLPAHTHVPGVTLSVSGGVGRPPMESDHRALQLWRQFEAEAATMGLDIACISTGGCSDGNFTSAQGVPTVDGMGLVGANAHRRDEYVELSSIVPQIRLIASVCQAIARRNPPV